MGGGHNLHLQRPPADLTCGTCGQTSSAGSFRLECVACLRSGCCRSCYCGAECFQKHWKSRDHYRSGALSARPRPASAMPSMRSAGDSSLSSGSSSSSPGTSPTVGDSSAMAATVLQTPPPPPRPSYAHRAYSPLLPSPHAGGFRNLYPAAPQRAVSAGGPGRDG